MAKILIVDDETRLGETICKLLSHADHDARDAHDGMERLEKVKLFTPDLIL